jgi:hypothetical protein
MRSPAKTKKGIAINAKTFIPGHGAGKPTEKVIEEVADIYAFLVKNLGMKLPTSAPSPDSGGGAKQAAPRR